MVTLFHVSNCLIAIKDIMKNILITLILIAVAPFAQNQTMSIDVASIKEAKKQIQVEKKAKEQIEKNAIAKYKAEMESEEIRKKENQKKIDEAVTSGIKKIQLEKKIDSRLSELEGTVFGNKSFRFGASLSYNILHADNDKHYYISPKDSTLGYKNKDRTGLFLSVVASVLPFLSDSTEETWGNTLGLYVNINLADFEENKYVFNKKIDGGVGLSYKWPNQDIGIGLGVETLSRRKFLDEYTKGNKVILDNEIVTSIDVNDDRLFYQDWGLAYSVKLIMYY